MCVNYWRVICPGTSRYKNWSESIWTDAVKPTVPNLPWWWINSLEMYAPYGWIHFFQGHFYCWKHLSYTLLGSSQSCCITLILVVPTSPNCLPFTVFLLWGKGYNYLKKFSFASEHWASQRLQTGAASSGVLSAVVGWSLLTCLMLKSVIKIPLHKWKEIPWLSSISHLFSLWSVFTKAFSFAHTSSFMLSEGHPDLSSLSATNVKMYFHLQGSRTTPETCIQLMASSWQAVNHSISSSSFFFAGVREAGGHKMLHICIILYRCKAWLQCMAWILLFICNDFVRPNRL